MAYVKHFTRTLSPMKLSLRLDTDHRLKDLARKCLSKQILPKLHVDSKWYIEEAEHNDSPLIADVISIIIEYCLNYDRLTSKL